MLLCKDKKKVQIVLKLYSYSYSFVDICKLVASLHIVAIYIKTSNLLE